MPAAAESPLAAILRRPFAEQVAFFRRKLGNLVPTQKWDDILGEAHDRAFMVAGAAKADLLADLAAAVDKAIADGETLDAFKGRFLDIVQRRGWGGWTGDDRTPDRPKGGAGVAWRARVIYETNLITSYGAGRLVQLKDGGYQYWVYKHSDFVRNPRPHHVALDGLVKRADDPFWQTYYPPNGWGCRCRVVGARGEKSARRLGGDPDKKAPDWVGDTDPETGEKAGVDKGWGYMPGGTVADTVRQSVAKKTIAWPYEIAKAYMAAVPEDKRDLLARAIRSQPETGESARRYAERALGVRNDAPIRDAIVQPYQTLGLLTRQEMKLAGVSGLWDWALAKDEIRHVIKRHGDPEREKRQGQLAVTPADFAIAAEALLRGGWRRDGVTETGAPALLHEYVRGGTLYIFVWELRSGRQMIALKSIRKRPAPGAERP